VRIRIEPLARRRPETVMVSALVFAVLLMLHGRAQASGANMPLGTGSHATIGQSAGRAGIAQPTGMSSMLDAASADVRYVADWIVRTGDNDGMPYVIIDKLNATVFVMDSSGHPDGSAPALLGMVRGDGSVAGIGDRKLSAIRPDERITPAGRFVASLGEDLHGQDILWIDYANAIALHRVVKGTPAERRAQRLQSATSEDNRISFGCINVPAKFFDDVVQPAFAESSGVVYILPEMSSVEAMYGRRTQAQRDSWSSPDTAVPAATGSVR
jgi:hypothetical protein